MLNKLRKKKIAKKIWIILAIIIVPAFALWGSGSLLRNRQESAYAGKIFGRSVSALEYKDALSAVKNQAIMQFGDKFPEIKKYLDLESQAWDRLILLQEAKKRNIKANDSQVIELIESYPFFQRNSKFDNGIYSQMLEYVFGIQPRAFEEQTRQNLILSKLYKQITDNIQVSEEETRADFQKANEELSIYYIASLPSDFAKDLNPAEEELKDYFQRNPQEFKQPVSFNLDYVASDSQEKLKDMVLRLNKRLDFEKTAKDLGLVVKETGPFTQTGPIPGLGWSPQLLDLISQFKIGQYSAPINMDKNYYIFRLKQKREAYVPEFAEIKGKVKEAVTKDNTIRQARERIEECLKKLKEENALNPQAVDFEKIANACGLKFNSTNYFKYGSYIDGIGASDSFWMAAATLKEAQFSEIISTPSGFYIIKPKSVLPLDEKKFESAKSELSQKLLLEKRRVYFSNFVAELKRKAF